MSAVLVLNAGSSSVKFALYEGEHAALRGEVDRIGIAPVLGAVDADGDAAQAPPGLLDPPPRDPGEAALRLLPWLTGLGGGLRGVGHRVVHGGAAHAGPVLATQAMLAELEALAPLAPLHQPHNLAPVRALLGRKPSLPQVLCFDTAFHRTQDPLAERFALPAALHDQGIRRYGFHGLSYESVAARLREAAPEAAAGRVVAAHLGAGASLCAMRGGRSVATTTGFTALDGLPMGTRCGALDPGVVLHLIRGRGMAPDAVEALLYKESGLKGVSGISSDVRDLLASGAPSARLALDLFVHRIVREAAGMAAALGGLDALVFTAGIGLHQPAIRAAVCRGLGFFGAAVDETANARNAARISPAGAAVQVLVVKNDENLAIARHARAALGAAEMGR